MRSYSVELRDCYAETMEEHAGEDYATAKADAERGIARIKADALREAADGIQAMDSRATLRGIATSIRVEADRIEEEA